MVLAGSVVNHSFLVKNAGNVALRGSQLVTVGLQSVSCTPPFSTSLAVGAELFCEAAHVVTQDEVEAGVSHVSATFTASNMPFEETTGTYSKVISLDPVQLYAVPSLRLALHTASCTTPTAAGELVAGWLYGWPWR